MNKEPWYSSDIFAVTLTSDVVLKPLELACGGEFGKVRRSPRML